MKRFIEGENRQRATFFPESLDDFVAEENPVRVVDVFVDKLDLSGLGFKTVAEATGRPGYRPEARKSSISQPICRLLIACYASFIR